MDDREKMERLAEIDQQLGKLRERHRAAWGPNQHASLLDPEEVTKVQAATTRLMDLRDQITTKYT
jgi:hypothetical protein